MNDNELHERLIDYVEGNISSEHKSEIESLLLHSPQMQNDVDVIKMAMAELQNMTDDAVPSHYFTNFLPRLRERIDVNTNYLPLLLPEWLRFLNIPFVVSVIIFSIGIMYQSFRPEEINLPIYSLVKDLDRSEINSIVDGTSDFGSTAGIIRGTENLAGDVSSAQIIESKLSEDLIASDVSMYQSENELLSDMGDSEIEKVLDRLGNPTIQ